MLFCFIGWCWGQIVHSQHNDWQIAQSRDCFCDFGRKLVNLRLPGNTQWCSATDGRTRQHRVMEDSLLPFTSLWENLTQAGLDFLIFVQRNKTDTALCNLSIKKFKCTICPQHHRIRVPKNESYLLAPESLVGNFSSEKIKIRENSIQARQKKCCAVCIYEEIIYNR